MRNLTICCTLLVLAACAAPGFSSSTLAPPPAARPLAGSIALDHPVGLAEDKHGNLYVANAGSSQILVYNSKNQQLSTKTITDGVDQPADLTFDKAGNLYATERSSNEVTVYAPSGKQITGKTLHTDKAAGFSPSGIQVDSSGDIWVANRNNTNYDVGEIQVFAAGKVIHSSTKELANPLGVIFSGTDTWVCDAETNDISVFDSTANLIKTISTGGFTPAYAAKDKSGDIYVTDEVASQIAVLDSAGKILKTTANKGLDNPAGIALNSAGDFYVANSTSNTITEYNSHGDLIHTIK
jgi:DNA-binding beta-propeller fold protein YncE